LEVHEKLALGKPALQMTQTKKAPHMNCFVSVGKYTTVPAAWSLNW
jgi:hypothetical protein